VFRVPVYGAAFAIACSSSHTISVLRSSAAARAPSVSALHVDVDATSAHLPLAVSGSALAYRDVERALAESLEKSLAPQLAQLSLRHAQQLVLLVELVEARADYAHERLVVELAVRATLRERTGNAYLAQTHAHHAAFSASAPEHGAPAVLECTDAIGSELSGWIAGIDLR
jgi:hypothetical protein